MRLKDDSVSLGGLQPQMVIALMVAALSFLEIGKELVITSGSDGEHSHKSLHYSGNAVDLRIRHLTAKEAEAIAQTIQERLNKHFDVVLEPTHLHIEYQPKRPQPKTKSTHPA